MNDNDSNLLIIIGITKEINETITKPTKSEHSETHNDRKTEEVKKQLQLSYGNMGNRTLSTTNRLDLLLTRLVK